MTTDKLMKILKSFDFKGISFVSVQNYSSQKSGGTEIANFLLNVGQSYASIQKKNLAKLESLNVSDLPTDNFSKELLFEAREAMINSIVSPNQKMSQAQKDIYLPLNPQGTVKFCKTTGSFQIVGVKIRKDVIQKGEFKEVKSRPLTLAKQFVEKYLNLTKPQYLTIQRIKDNGLIKTGGDTITFECE